MGIMEGRREEIKMEGCRGRVRWWKGRGGNDVNGRGRKGRRDGREEQT